MTKTDGILEKILHEIQALRSEIVQTNKKVDNVDMKVELVNTNLHKKIDGAVGELSDIIVDGNDGLEKERIKPLEKRVKRIEQHLGLKASS